VARIDGCVVSNRPLSVAAVRLKKLNIVEPTASTVRPSSYSVAEDATTLAAIQIA
jgi:hypothetical protein